jgi:CRP-like cAMP-binding protein
VAVTETGGYFGEMSLLTGDPRSATVLAVDDCTLVEITADAFRDVVLRNPAVLDTITADVTRRRGELAAAQSAAARMMPSPEAAHSLLARVRRFLLGSTAL